MSHARLSSTAVRPCAVVASRIRSPYRSEIAAPILKGDRTADRLSWASSCSSVSEDVSLGALTKNPSLGGIRDYYCRGGLLTIISGLDSARDSQQRIEAPLPAYFGGDRSLPTMRDLAVASRTDRGAGRARVISGSPFFGPAPQTFIP